MNLKLLLTRFARASFDIITHKNLRKPRSIRLKPLSNMKTTSSILYTFFTAFYILQTLILSLLIVIIIPFWFGSGSQGFANDFLSYFLGYFPIFYFIPLGISYWIHSYWSNKLWVANGGLDSEWKISISESEKRETLFQAIKDLQTLRAEVIEMEQQGIDVSDLIKEIESSDKKLLGEAKKDLSIEEIAKLQEEFVNSLDKENAT